MSAPFFCTEQPKQCERNPILPGAAAMMMAVFWIAIDAKAKE
jgi:hypothetical protein